MAIEPAFEVPQRMHRSDRYVRRRRRYAFLAVGLAAGLVVGLVAGVMLGGPSRTPQVAAPGGAMNTRYQAVTLTNGQMLVGRLEKLGTAFPVLSDIHTVRARASQDAKEPTQALLSRGADEPDTMILNADHILFVEPVRSGSRLGKLIEEAKSRQ